ncbi:hypothetical protein [Algimonas arctica]|uniref:hypothetical protein n=1 Tax=Algimonas arctica TaxID=1479486 RepID=UPI00167A7396|nr:hypothetical protein [Algimonas arctica]
MIHIMAAGAGSVACWGAGAAKTGMENRAAVVRMASVPVRARLSVEFTVMV